MNWKCSDGDPARAVGARIDALSDDGTVSAVDADGGFNVWHTAEPPPTSGPTGMTEAEPIRDTHYAEESLRLLGVMWNALSNDARWRLTLVHGGMIDRIVYGLKPDFRAARLSVEASAQPCDGEPWPLSGGVDGTVKPGDVAHCEACMNDCLGLKAFAHETAPIPLNDWQVRAAKQWAAYDRLWTTQDTVEFNLRTFARFILAAASPVRAPQEDALRALIGKWEVRANGCDFEAYMAVNKCAEELEAILTVSAGSDPQEGGQG